MMKAHMDDLPSPAIGGGNIPISQPLDSARDKSDQLNQSKTDDASGHGVPTGGAGVSKEVESGGLPPAEQLRPATPEVELPKEVARAGVKVQPTTIPIPPNVAQLGVQPAGQNIPPAGAQPVTMPITEEQIAQGLQQSIISSWRWLAEWCVRRLRQLHMGIRSVHGKFT